MNLFLEIYLIYKTDLFPLLNSFNRLIINTMYAETIGIYDLYD